MNNFSSFNKEATRNKAEVEHLTSNHAALAGNGVSKTQVQMRSNACKDMMFTREGHGGVQLGSVAVNGSRYEIKGDAPIKLNTSAAGHWNARILNPSYLPRYRAEKNTDTGQWEEVKDNTLIKLKKR